MAIRSDAVECFLEWYTFHYNKFFWLIFLAAGITFIAGLIWSIALVFYFQVLLGAVIITGGIHRLGEELNSRSMRRVQARIDRDIDEIIQWMTKSHDYTLSFKNRHENRFMRLDKKRAELESKFDSHADGMAKKMIDVENKVNRTLKRAERDALVLDRIEQMAKQMMRERELLERRILDLSSRQARALKQIRKGGQITNKEYRVSYKVSEKSAYNELKDLESKGLITKKGRGRTTHYVLAF